MAANVASEETAVAPKKWRVPIPVAVLVIIALAYGGYRYYESHRPYEWSGTVEASVDKAQLDQKRAAELLATKAISQAEADNADSALRSANALRDAARAAVDELEHGTRKEDLAQASARAQEANASAKLVQAGARV